MIVCKLESQVPYTARQMFDLVADIEKYPEFVPGCRHLSVLWREERELEARMQTAFLGFTFDFTSKVSLNPPGGIEIASIGHGVRQFDARWSFEDEDTGGCLVSYQMEIKTALGVFDGMMGGILRHMGQSTVAAFVKRAASLYRKAS